jgi:hypothetical protein
LVGNGCATCNNGIIVGRGIFCAVHYTKKKEEEERRVLRRQYEE